MNYELNKTCPICSQEFSGRSNQIYCSKNCKQVAFKNGETNLSSIPKTAAVTETHYPMVIKQEKPENKEKILELQIRLRRMEQEHEAEMLQLKYDEEKNLKQLDIEHWKQKERSEQLEKELQQEREKIKEKKIKLYTLRPNEKRYYVRLVNKILENDEEKVNLEFVEEVLSEIEEFIEAIDGRLEESDDSIDASDITEYALMESLQEMFQDTCDDLNSRSFLASSYFKLSLDQEMVDELNETL